VDGPLAVLVVDSERLRLAGQGPIAASGGEGFGDRSSHTPHGAFYFHDLFESQA